MPYHMLATFKQSQLVLMLLYDCLNLIISGFTNHIWAVEVIGQKK